MGQLCRAWVIKVNRITAKNCVSCREVASTYVRHNVAFSYDSRKFPIEPVRNFALEDSKKEGALVLGGAPNQIQNQNCAWAVSLK